MTVNNGKKRIPIYRINANSDGLAIKIKDILAVKQSRKVEVYRIITVI